MTNKPKLAKARSKLVFDEYLRLGWTVASQSFDGTYREDKDEYLFEWRHETDPVYIDWDEFHRKHRK
jgi:hypothetical protein